MSGLPERHAAVLASRGALKLRAALERLQLGGRVRGARAIDVGASPGGFTAVLLEHGAESVVSIDAGHGQLAESLRSEPRVTLLEKTDFRRASLEVAEGPFGFFVVDVSFVAARNMLRSLAFRLLPGASGMLLLKPQFELGKRALRGHSVAEPVLRAQALELLRERAERCGFRVVEAQDSPVPGESGTVEIVVHLAFAGRPASWPKRADENEPAIKGHGPQDRAAPKAPPARRPRAAAADAMLHEHAWFANAAPGLEALLAAELSELAAVAPALRDVRLEAGGVAFSGNLLAGYAVNLATRLATRVLVRAGTVKARELALLRRKLRELPFERFIAPGAALRLLATAHHCRLYHTGALIENLELAIGDRLRKPIVRVTGNDEEDSSPESELPFGREPYGRVLLRGQDDVFVASVDSSGLLLHRRGGRPEAGAAPLRETLAAAVLRCAGYDGTQTLVDAMCGSGTLALEAAGIALGRLPGGQRAFAIEAFAGVERAALEAERARLGAAIARSEHAPIHAFDKEPSMIALARRNAERSQLAQHIAFSAIELRDAAPPSASGLLVANPPYGKRLGRPEELKRRYRAIGDALRARWQGFRVALLVPRETPHALFQLKLEQRVALLNGGVPVSLLIGTPER